jgi:hypothetical protein
MKRPQLEHILRAAAAITGADRFVVIGSQAILGQVPDPPAELVVSIEADLFSLRGAEDADLIDGTIGELSPFHRTFGYYAHGVGEETAVLPRGWRERLVPLRSPNTGGATGLCLEVHAGRLKARRGARERPLLRRGSGQAPARGHGSHSRATDANSVGRGAADGV